MRSHGCAAEQNYSFQVWDSVDEIDAAAWESLQQNDDIFMDLRLLRVMAASIVDTELFSFLLMRDDQGKPVAATCLWRFTSTGTLLAEDNWIVRAFEMVSSVLTTLNNHRVLVCGMPISAGQSNLRIASGANRHEVLSALNSKLMSIAQSEGLRYIIFKEFEQIDLEFKATMNGLGYYCADSLPMNQVDAKWHSFEAYLGSLPAKKRWKVKDTRKKLQEGPLRLVVTSDPEEVAQRYSDSVHQLYQAVLEKSEVQLETLPAAFFRELPAQFPRGTSYSFILEGDTVHAFGVVLHAQNVSYPLYVGVNYELNNQFDLYFNIMFSMFEESLRRGTELVSWGQTADEVKQIKLNCYQTPRHFYLKGTNWFAKMLLGSLYSHLFPQRSLALVETLDVAERRAA